MSMSPPLRLGIAVCTYRRPAGLARLLSALAAEVATLGDPPVVIVVDNDGTDPGIATVAAGAADLDVRLCVEPVAGISAARNRAFAEAEAAGLTTLALIDDDEWPEPGWLAALLARRSETGAAVVGGVVVPEFPREAAGLVRWRRFWSVLPQARAGRPFVHATSNVLVDLAALRGLPRPLFADGHGLSGGGDLVFFSRLFDRGVAMAWATDAIVREEVPPERASLAWLVRRRRRVGNHMVMDEEARHGRLRPLLKTAALLARLPLYPLLCREPEAWLVGWRLEAVKLGGRIAAHRGWRSYEYARDGISERRIVRS
jgi:succinoglycan biosynthesis protein ExoM